MKLLIQALGILKGFQITGQTPEGEPDERILIHDRRANFERQCTRILKGEEYIQNCIYLFKKVVASLIIFSMLMIDVAKAMDEERSSAHVVHKIPLPKPPSSDPVSSDPDNRVDNDSSLRQSLSSDDGDSSPGSISSSPESQKPGSGVEDNSLAIIPFVKLSLVPPQASIVSGVQQNLDEIKEQPSALPIPSQPDPSLSISGSFDEFSPFAVGSLEQNRQAHRQSLIADLPKTKAPTGSAKGAPSTAPPQVTSIILNSLAFISMEVSCPQLHSNMGTSPSGGSLQDRSQSYIPSPHIAPQTHNNSSKPIILVQSSFVDSHPLEDSDTDSDKDQVRVSLKPSTQLSTIQSQKEKKPSPNSSVPLLRSKRELSSAPPVVSQKKPETNIDAIIKALLPEDRSPNSLFPEEQNERIASDSIQIDDEQSPLLQLSANGITYASIPVDHSRSEEFVLLGKDQELLFHERKDKRSFRIQHAANTSPPPVSSSIPAHQVSEKSPLLPHQSLNPNHASIQTVESIYEEFELLGGDQDPPIPLRAGEDESRQGCCCNRPCWPQHTEYTLPNAEAKLQQLSQKLALLRQPQIIEGNGSVNGRAGQIIEFKPLPNPDGQDESREHSDSSGGSVDVSSSSNDNSPEKRGPPPILVVGDQTTSDDEQGDFFLPVDLLKDDQISDEEEEQSLPVLPAKGSLSGSPHSVNSDQEEEEVALAVVPSDLQDVFDNVADLERGMAGHNLSSFLSFCRELQSYLKNLPAKTKSQLTDFAYQVLNGKSTWPQRLGKWIIGPIIGVGFSLGMGPIYDGGVIYLADQYEAFNSFLNGTAGAIFIYYVNISALPDGIARNAHLLKKGIGYLFQEGKEIGRMCLAGAIGAMMSVIPLAYLINAENIGREILGDTGWNNQFGVWVAVCGPPLVIDAFASDFNTAWSTIPEIKEWFGKLFCRKSLHSRILSLEDVQREKFDSDLGKLKNFLFRAPNDVIDEIYGDIKQIKESLETSFCGTLDEDLAAEQAFATVSYLLSLGDEIEKGISKPKSIFDISFDLFKYACLIFGAPTAMLLLQFVGTTVSGFLCLNFCPEVVTESIGGGFALIAFIPMVYLLNKYMSNFKKWLVQEDPHDYGSHPIYRFVTKLYIAVQSLIYLFPTSVAILQAYQHWFGSGWWPLVPAIPFLIPKFTSLVCNFNGTFNEQVATSIINGCHKVDGKCSGDTLCTACKKDWLIRFIEVSRGELKHWHAGLVQKLTEGAAFFKD